MFALPLVILPRIYVKQKFLAGLFKEYAIIIQTLNLP